MAPRQRSSRLFYADQFDGQRMKNLTIVDRSQSGLNQIVVSESAMWNTAQNIWDFQRHYLFGGSDSSYQYFAV